MPNCVLLFLHFLRKTLLLTTTILMMNASSSSSSIKLSSIPSRAASRVATARNCGKRRSFLRVSAEQRQRYETSADASSSSSSSLLVHTVSPGDSLYGVAMQYDVDPRDLIVRFSLFSLSRVLGLCLFLLLSKRKRTRLFALVKFSNSSFFEFVLIQTQKNVRLIV